ncbi:hypothetical protein N7510_010898 [Penicillium lagena]|uniref:uncharacterized protein n=1 Tax=Penicillium lagena TaxID=94218 RepID=UPI0025418504|nr:uncharacterized protein N7510_010898 [Penicillium lagena]KAJ5601364.1 hypothetical protein N7510_010898 [Penicillium lagena]
MPSSVAYSETRTLSDAGRALARLGQDNTASDVDQGRPRNDDIFLNIARSDSTRRESLGRSDFRRSRLGYSGPSLRTPTATTPRRDEEQTPSPDQRLTNTDSPLLSQNGSPTIPYSSFAHSSASAHPLDDPNRFRYSGLASGPRSTIGVPRSRLSRTSPDASPQSPSVNGERRSSIHDPHLYRHSGLSTIRSSRQASGSEVTERPRMDGERSRADGTESTLSTTAPSTVWDELEDLKSRIRKLEITGKLPPSSQAAISGASHERPRTATTTVTTLSSSPKHGRKISTPTTDAENSSAQNQVHPLLQSALAKAKSILNTDVYAALEVTITDALNLSGILGANAVPLGSVSVVNGGGYSSSERQARRKADSLCRSLTELCLALSDEQLKKNRSPVTSRDGPAHAQPSNGPESPQVPPTPSYQSSYQPAFQRSASHEPEVAAPERHPSTARISRRLESRRASLAFPSALSSTETASETKTPQTPSIPPTPTSRLHRISTSLRNRRAPAEEENQETTSPHSRSLSRAMTEVGVPSAAPSKSPRQRYSHSHSVSRSISGAQHGQGFGLSSPHSPQYQLQQPSPAQPQSSLPRTPSTVSQSGLQYRRSYAPAPASSTPATSRSNIQAGSRRYGISPGYSPAQGSGGEDSPNQPQPEAPQTRISALSGKMASSYTPIQQPRVRTNSLGARRFGLKYRSPPAPDDGVKNLDDSID